MNSADTQKTDLETRRKRVIYRAWHRGTRELDMLIGRFAERFVTSMDSAKLDEFEQLMEASEPQLMAWLSEQEELPDWVNAELIEQMRSFHAQNPVASD